MKARLKQFYVEQTTQKCFAYDEAGLATKRLWGIFMTSNSGRFGRKPLFDPPAGASGMQSVWAVLAQIAACPQDIPKDRLRFDAWAKTNVWAIAKAYSSTSPYPLGIAQKTLNLFMKDLWAWDKLQPEQEHCLHAPIDRIIYQRFAKAPKCWKSWTLVRCKEEKKLDALWDDYMVLQSALRERSSMLSTESLTLQPIMLEQILWGSIEPPTAEP